MAQLEAGVRCKWSWSCLKLESKCDMKGKECVSTVTVIKINRETRPCQLRSAAKRSIMLPRSPMPFWHIVVFVVPFTS